jgi:hypothetical protein
MGRSINETKAAVRIASQSGAGGMEMVTPSGVVVAVIRELGGRAEYWRTGVDTGIIVWKSGWDSKEQMTKGQ